MRQLEEVLVTGDNAVFPVVSQGAETYSEMLDQTTRTTYALKVASDDLRNAILGDDPLFEAAQKDLANYQAQLESVANQSAITARQLRDTQSALDTAKAQNVVYQTTLEGLANGSYVWYQGQAMPVVQANALKAAAAQKSSSSKKKSSGGGGSSSGGSSSGGAYYSSGSSSSSSSKSNLATVAKKVQSTVSNILKKNQNSNGRNFSSGKSRGFGSKSTRGGAFATGGYTGDWNDGVADWNNGKLAILHQKELVLNESDTKNILSAVQAIRTISASAQGALASQKIRNYTSLNDNNLGGVEQRVEIQAHFPNATDANDIREALLGLSDKAYQYAHRKI